MTTLEDTRFLPTALQISVRLARRRRRHRMEPARAATSVPIGVIDRSRGKEKAFLPSPTGRPRGDERTDLSPHDELAVGILPPLEEDFFQTLANEITARGGTNASDGGFRRPVFCSDLLP
jgi:hypothetical protein